jgi:alpha-galactosidase
MSNRILSSFQFNDIVAQYISDANTRSVGLILIPEALKQHLENRREILCGNEFDNLPENMKSIKAYHVDPIVQVKCSISTLSLAYKSQITTEDKEKTVVKTTLESQAGFLCEHKLTWYRNQPNLEILTVFRNISDKSITLEMLSSFSIGGITPFHYADAPERLVIHRFRSAWSAEGRLETQPVENLHLERSWSGHGVACERFGQVGSMPVRGFFPFVAIEDIDKKVLWGAQLAWAGSWQMEIYRKDDCFAISGGLADREFGHWMKEIKPGESFCTPKAVISVAQGNIDTLCQRLTTGQKRSMANKPKIESDLPIIFNEYGCSWGQPSEQEVLKIADRLENSHVKYLVIDAGWYAEENKAWYDSHGDWTPSKKLFPSGLKATADYIKSKGLIPGIWFEMETVGPKSTACSLDKYLLKRDGIVIKSDGRRFWDFRAPYTFDYLTKKVIELLGSCGFGYVKIDYNDTIGIGVDGAESLGEGLRQHIEGVYRFFNKISESLPDIVIENCSSGGHRLEPSMMALASMASFSDAHETLEIPIIAANLHRLILPQQSQIWAVLRKNHDERRLSYLLTAAFLGRMCLSGDVCELTDKQWKHVLKVS